MSELRAGQRVRIIASDKHAPYRRAEESEEFLGMEGTYTGRKLYECIEVRLPLGLNGRTFAPMFHPSEVQPLEVT